MATTKKNSYNQSNSYNYNKRPLWQYITIYIVIGIVVYGLIYLLFFRKSNHYQASVPMTKSSQMMPSSNQPSNNIYMMRSDTSGKSYLTDFQGMTLYTSDADVPGTSSCVADCATVWKPYTSGAINQKTFPVSISFVMRGDGSKQFAWKGLPLYYYVNDNKVGDMNGNGMNGFHVISQ